MKFYFTTFILVFLSLSLYAMDPNVAILGHTPLHLAAGDGKVTQMRKVLKNGVTEYIEDEWGLIEIADHKGKAVLELKNDKGETALHVAVRRNHLDAAAFLVDQGANMKARDKEGKTPALTAAAYGRVRLLGYLLTKHSNLKVTTPEGKTLMHVAVTAPHGKPIDTVAFLTKCGMSVNVQDSALCTPLHDALRANVSQEIVSCLQRLGADLDAKDKDGITPRSLLKGYEQGKESN